MSVVGYIVIAVAAYLLGSIPTGFLMARAKGVDIRTVGSGNIGATNTFRALGKPAGVLVLLMDVLKGYAACTWLAALVLRYFVRPDITETEGEWVRLLAGICVVLGHNYTCFLKLKGGKGIATTAGVFLALAPAAVGIAILAWVILFVTTRYVSVASIAAAIVLPVCVWILSDNVLLGVVTTAMGALAIYKHKGNIQRLRAGTESRICFGRQKGAT